MIRKQAPQMLTFRPADRLWLSLLKRRRDPMIWEGPVKTLAPKPLNTGMTMNEDAAGILAGDEALTVDEMARLCAATSTPSNVPSNIRNEHSQVGHLMAMVACPSQMTIEFDDTGRQWSVTVGDRVYCHANLVRALGAAIIDTRLHVPEAVSA
jgi:hypothetical protein